MLNRNAFIVLNKYIKFKRLKEFKDFHYSYIKLYNSRHITNL